MKQSRDMTVISHIAEGLPRTATHIQVFRDSMFTEPAVGSYPEPVTSVTSISVLPSPAYIHLDLQMAPLP